jgi:hypothetical protein
MKKLRSITILILLSTLISCTSNSIDDDPDSPGGIDPDDVTYKTNIKPLIDGKCLGCHTNPPTNNAPMPLTTYDNVKDAVMTRGLIGRVEDGSMPLVGSDLTDSQVQQIKDWQAGEFKE